MVLDNGRGGIRELMSLLSRRGTDHSDGGASMAESTSKARAIPLGPEEVEVNAGMDADP